MKTTLRSLVGIFPCLLLCVAQEKEPIRVTDQTLASEEQRKLLETPGKVLFVDDGETEASLDRYFEVRGRKEKWASIDTQKGAAHQGQGALRFSVPDAKGEAAGSGATAWLGDAGHDMVHLRYYIRFADDYNQGNLNHTGGSIAAVSGTNKWQGMGQAGKRPKGDDYFNCRFEPWCAWKKLDPPGYLFVYTYWMGMKQDADGNYWGNMLEPEESKRFLPKRGRWYCLEHMMRANSPGKNDGELAAWIDGKLYLHYKGIRWRSEEKVRIKRIDLGVYIHSCTQTNTAWFDDIVVSTGYIGPIK